MLHIYTEAFTHCISCLFVWRSLQIGKMVVLLFFEVGSTGCQIWSIPQFERRKLLLCPLVNVNVALIIYPQLNDVSISVFYLFLVLAFVFSVRYILSLLLLLLYIPACDISCRSSLGMMPHTFTLSSLPVKQRYGQKQCECVELGIWDEGEKAEKKPGNDFCGPIVDSSISLGLPAIWIKSLSFSRSFQILRQ